MEGKEHFEPNRKETPLTALYQESVARESRVVMSEAAELEQRFVYEAAKHQSDSVMKEKQPVLENDGIETEEHERTEMVKDAAGLVEELAGIIQDAPHDDIKQIASDLKESLESFVGKKSEMMH